MLVKKEVE